MPLRPETISARGARCVPSDNQPLTPPIYQTSVYTFEDQQQLDSVWEEETEGFIYGRFGGPNTKMLEELVSELECAEAAVACASGMGALHSLFSTLFRAGDHVVAGRDLYGATTALLAKDMRRLGVEVSFVDASVSGNILAALQPKTRAVFVEAISNPRLKLVDIHSLAVTLRELNIKLIVDASFASPAILRPIEIGADFVIQSATKLLSGHGDTTAGLVVGPKALLDRVRDTVIRLGCSLGPFDAWLVARGIKTLSVRVAKQCENAMTLARLLDTHVNVESVYYPGLASHPQYQLATRTFHEGFGTLVSFELRDGEKGVTRFWERLQLIEFAPSFGDTTTTWTYPSRTTHRQFSEKGKQALGIHPGLVRLSVGIESAEDLIRDLLQALD